MHSNNNNSIGFSIPMKTTMKHEDDDDDYFYTRRRPTTLMELIIILCEVKSHKYSSFFYSVFSFLSAWEFICENVQAFYVAS